MKTMNKQKINYAINTKISHPPINTKSWGCVVNHNSKYNKFMNIKKNRHYVVKPKYTSTGKPSKNDRCRSPK